MSNDNLDDEVKYIESLLKPGDWMLVTTTEWSPFGAAIRWACKSITNHGEPIYYSKISSKWVALNAKPLQLGVLDIRQVLELARSGKRDFIICRQTIEDQQNFESKAIPFLDHLEEVKPYYNLIDYPKLIYWSFRLRREKQKFIKLLMQRGGLEALNYQVQKIENILEKLQHSTYCTQILYDMWIKFGKNIFKEYYNVEFCRPTEQEKLVQDEKYQFIYGYYNKEVSNALYTKIVENI